MVEYFRKNERHTDVCAGMGHAYSAVRGDLGASSSGHSYIVRSSRIRGRNKSEQ